ncbi:tRNA uridine(34) 5-carboxymethylaminomethyl modification radical SAM/GNAT enzyme Elp3 [Candidatus Pacearchaeota archaeon]|nr:tRNA uridine(34) 5-carboxymethylaminomethyl modification radical SAM/GNAT enzyme Elp3 [Candidatus Pacearchaeota archaeon]
MVHLKNPAFRKPTKTISGVTPIAVMLKPRQCKHGACLYCPSLNVPQSYTPESPAVLRARMLDYDPYKQVRTRLKAFQVMKHPTSKIELIVMGGTFLEYPKSYQENFIKRCYDALNNKTSRTLEQAKKINESAMHRCIALCIETRPDVCGEKEIQRMLKFGATRVELGVQAIDDKIYKIVNRGHTVKDVIKATKLLRDNGFKIGYHIMPGLPGSNPKKDLQMFKELFANESFKPDQLKIYPCQVIKGSNLEKLYEQGKYKPYTEQQLIDLIIKMLRLVPEYCRVMRIMREIPPQYLIAGTLRIDLRKLIEKEIREKGIKLNEIRSREIGIMIREGKKIDKHLKLKIMSYQASNGKEYFLSVINKQNFLFALCRLRIKNKQAIIRELHVYGKSLSLGEKGQIQHTGLGKQLMQEAEKIAKNCGVKKLQVIAGIGARQYFYKLGYKLNEPYVSKELK